MDRNNHKLNAVIEDYIRIWKETAIGTGVKNMYENGSDYESICEVMRIEYADYEEG